jgi:diguanylate cyclase
MIIDVDHFKLINDRFGHQSGDAVLRLLAHIFKSTLRETDVIGRWGGEEFMVILPNTSMEQGAIVAETLRRTVETYPFDLDQPITISVGIGKLKKSLSIHETIAFIDEALYEAKKSGRNQVCQAD